MAENISTPRISGTYLQAFTNQTVRMVGKVTQLRGDSATLDAGGVDVTALLNRVRLPSLSLLHLTSHALADQDQG